MSLKHGVIAIVILLWLGAFLLHDVARADEINCNGFNGTWINGKYLGPGNTIYKDLNMFRSSNGEVMYFTFSNCQIIIKQTL